MKLRIQFHNRIPCGRKLTEGNERCHSSLFSVTSGTVSADEVDELFGGLFETRAVVDSATARLPSELADTKDASDEFDDDDCAASSTSIGWGCCTKKCATLLNYEYISRHSCQPFPLTCDVVALLFPTLVRAVAMVHLTGITGGKRYTT